jgi:hypothetical protein
MRYLVDIQSLLDERRFCVRKRFSTVPLLRLAIRTTRLRRPSSSGKTQADSPLTGEVNRIVSGSGNRRTVTRVSRLRIERSAAGRANRTGRVAVTALASARRSTSSTTAFQRAGAGTAEIWRGQTSPGTLCIAGAGISGYGTAHAGAGTLITLFPDIDNAVAATRDLTIGATIDAVRVTAEAAVGGYTGRTVAQQNGGLLSARHGWVVKAEASTIVSIDTGQAVVGTAATNAGTEIALLAAGHYAVVAPCRRAINVATVATHHISVVAGFAADTVSVGGNVGHTVAAERKHTAISTSIGIFVAIARAAPVGINAYAADTAILVDYANIV